MLNELRVFAFVSFVGLSSLFVFLPAARSRDKIMGEVHFIDATREVKTSGVWVDGQYVGYLGELKGSSTLRLLPGSHEITVRQAGYEDFTRRVTIEPGKAVEVKAAMERDTRFQYPEAKTSAEIRLNVRPDRAAVFLDDNYVGHVDDFYGVDRAMLVVPGKHDIKIALGGYKTFETELTLLPRQKFALKTELAEGSINDADPLIKTDRSASLGANSLRNETSGRAEK